jgi:hypothetical protein
MSKEIIDKDLLYNNDVPSIDDDDGIPVHNVPTIGLGEITKHKQQLDQKISNKMKELEQLEYLQRELEEKNAFLDKLSEHQILVEQKRRRMILSLSKAIILLEKQLDDTQKFHQLIENAYLCFSRSVEDLKAVDSEKWINDDHEFSEELAATAALVEATEKEFKRISSKIETANFYLSPNKIQSSLKLANEFNDDLNGRSFGHIFRAGFIFALPMIILLILFFAVLSFF